MNIENTIRYQEKYIKENNYKKICSFNLYCCELNFYKNGIDYLQQFICYIYKS
jgi:hypothetical protein